MPKLTPLHIRGVIEKLKKLGYKGPFAGGRHSHMRRNGHSIPVPIHGNKDIRVGLIRKIINEVNITPQERINL